MGKIGPIDTQDGGWIEVNAKRQSKSSHRSLRTASNSAPRPPVDRILQHSPDELWGRCDRIWVNNAFVRDDDFTCFSALTSFGVVVTERICESANSESANSTPPGDTDRGLSLFASRYSPVSVL